MSTSVIVGIAVGIFLILDIVFIVFLRRKIRQHKASLAPLMMNSIFSGKANFLGQESGPTAQLSGTGTLVLTRDELFFQMMIPQRKISIPLSRITGTEAVSSYQRFTRFKPLLKVMFQNDAGKSDSMGFSINSTSVEEWRKQIATVLKK